MTTWKEAADEYGRMTESILMGYVYPIGDHDVDALGAELVRLGDTLPVAQQTMPHDLANIGRMLAIAYGLGMRAGIKAVIDNSDTRTRIKGA